MTNAMTEDYIEKQDEEKFKIDTIGKANWAISKIKEEEARAKMFIESCRMKINEVSERISHEQAVLDESTAWLRNQLAEFIKVSPAQKAKNSMSLKLEGGTIRLKYSLPQYIHDDMALISALQNTEFVEIRSSLKWGELKKILSMNGEFVVRSDTGEVVDGITVKYTDEKLEVE